MAGTYLSMQQRVQRRVIDLPSAVLAEVPQLVNTALKQLQEGHNFKVMESEFSVYTTVDSHTMAVSVGGAAWTLPTSPSVNFKEWRGEPWFTRYQDGSTGPMTWAPSKEALWSAFSEGGATNSDRGYPMVLLEGVSDDSNVRTISVYPLPDGASDFSDGEYRITVPYYRYLPELSADGSSNWLTLQPSGEEFIVNWAAGEAHGLNWDYEKEAVMKSKAEINRKMVVNADKRFRLSSVREWVPHYRGVHSTKTRV